MKPIQKRFDLSVSPDNSDVTVVYLYGYVTSQHYWDEQECIATKDVRQALLGIKTTEIHLHINSPGGNAFDGIAIHNLLKHHPAKVTAYIDGIAASAASVIAMGANEIIMPKNSMLMIHCASTFAYGNAAELRKEADTLEKVDTAVANSYKVRFVGTDEELAALLADETWLTANEALALGLCNSILEESEAEPQPPKNAILQKYGCKSKEELITKPQAKLNLSNCLEAFLNGVGGCSSDEKFRPAKRRT